MFRGIKRLNFLFVLCHVYRGRQRSNILSELQMFLQESKAVRRLVSDWLVRLASYRSSKTGGHSHCTRTHQQVLVMDATLGLGVTQASRGEPEPGEWGKRETGTREITVNTHARHHGHTINTDTNTGEV